MAAHHTAQPVPVTVPGSRRRGRETREKGRLSRLLVPFCLDLFPKGKLIGARPFGRGLGFWQVGTGRACAWLTSAGGGGGGGGGGSRVGRVVSYQVGMSCIVGGPFFYSHRPTGRSIRTWWGLGVISVGRARRKRRVICFVSRRGAAIFLRRGACPLTHVQ